MHTQVNHQRPAEKFKNYDFFLSKASLKMINYTWKTIHDHVLENYAATSTTEPGTEYTVGIPIVILFLCVHASVCSCA